MAKGYDQNQERKNIVSGFGKDLARRAKSKCELCEAQGVKLNIYELPPVKAEPDFDRCIFLCDSCIDILHNLKKVEESRVRFLMTAIWSETSIVQATALYMVRQLSERFPWAADLVEEVYIDDSVAGLSETIKFDK